VRPNTVATRNVVQREFGLTFNGAVGVNVRAVPDLFARQADRQSKTVRQRRTNRVRGNQNFPARQPLTRVDDIVPDDPFLIIEVDVVDVADRPIDSNQGRAAEFLDAA
jgi:hypothetical protein